MAQEVLRAFELGNELLGDGVGHGDGLGGVVEASKLYCRMYRVL